MNLSANSTAMRIEKHCHGRLVTRRVRKSGYQALLTHTSHYGAVQIFRAIPRDLRKATEPAEGHILSLLRRQRHLHQKRWVRMCPVMRNCADAVRRADGDGGSESLRRCGGDSLGKLDSPTGAMIVHATNTRIRGVSDTIHGQCSGGRPSLEQEGVRGRVW